MTASELTQQLRAIASSPPTDLKEEERLALLTACENTKLALENPLEATLRLMLGVISSAALRLAVDMKLIDLAIAAQGPVTAEQLASGSGADHRLVVRVMRVLVAQQLFKETGRHTYVAKPAAGIYVTGSPFRDSIIHVGSQIPMVAILPEYFEEKGYQNPTDAANGPFQFMKGSTQHYFDWLTEKPRLQAAFNATMAISYIHRGEDWFNFFPVQDTLHVDDPSRTLLVDIGGNLGHDIINFHKKFPDVPGKLIFADLPVVIDATKDIPEGIEGIPYDFFEPLPDNLKNAKAYYLRQIIHDWPDKQAKQILENVAKGMTKDSVLLINENVMPEENASMYQVHLDFLMMAFGAALERTEKQFEELLDSAGLKLVKIWGPKNDAVAAGVVFEAVLKQ